MLLIHCLLLLSIFCGDFVFGPCFVVQCLVPFLVLRSFRWVALLGLFFDAL